MMRVSLFQRLGPTSRPRLQPRDASMFIIIAALRQRFLFSHLDTQTLTRTRVSGSLFPWTVSAALLEHLVLRTTAELSFTTSKVPTRLRLYCRSGQRRVITIISELVLRS